MLFVLAWSRCGIMKAKEKSEREELLGSFKLFKGYMEWTEHRNGYKFANSPWTLPHLRHVIFRSNCECNYLFL